MPSLKPFIFIAVLLSFLLHASLFISVSYEDKLHLANLAPLQLKLKSSSFEKDLSVVKQNKVHQETRGRNYKNNTTQETLVSKGILTKEQKHKLEQITSSYEAQVIAWLEKEKRFPRQASQQGFEGEVRLSLSLFPNGNIKNYAIVEGAAPVFRQEVKRMLQAASPFPEFPQDLQLAVHNFEILVEFQLH